MPYSYDTDNIFAKLLRGEIPVTPVLETEHSLAFPDIRPQAPEHILVIPKGSYVSFDHFSLEASDEEIIDFVRAIGTVCKSLGVSLDQGDGYRMISNAGLNGVQEIPHLHVHILAGKNLGPMLVVS